MSHQIAQNAPIIGESISFLWKFVNL